MQCGANNYATLLVGRIVGGFAIGLLSMTVPLYNVSSPHHFDAPAYLTTEGLPTD